MLFFWNFQDIISDDPIEQVRILSLGIGTIWTFVKSWARPPNQRGCSIMPCWSPATSKCRRTLRRTASACTNYHCIHQPPLLEPLSAWTWGHPCTWHPDHIHRYPTRGSWMVCSRRSHLPSPGWRVSVMSVMGRFQTGNLLQCDEVNGRKVPNFKFSTSLQEASYLIFCFFWNCCNLGHKQGICHRNNPKTTIQCVQAQICLHLSLTSPSLSPPVSSCFWMTRRYE